MTGLRIALGFLTLIPVPATKWEPARAVVWYPVVGGILAVLAGMVAFAAYHLAAPPLASALTLAVWVVLTGGLHLDGLADSADAAFASVDRARRLEILRDVHHGTFALLAIALVLLLKFGALATLDARGAAAAVALSIVTGRAWLPLVMRAFPAARPSGLGVDSRGGASRIALGGGAIVCVAAGAVAFGVAGIGVALGGGATAAAVAAWLASRFGGLTGDAYGAVVECTEVAVLAAASILVTNGHATAFPVGRWT